ncbi:MAG: NfeD family protein [Pelagimonas sp.]|uniref:NfeD family protein n=1 Tax=Pelagimonas sp. TaxID=2073170 RepID=UPI003D6A920A
MMWDQWWIWAGAGIVLLIIEVFAPGFVFLGFGVGALAVALILAVGGGLITSLSVALLVFAVCSLVAWLVIRRLAGERKGQIKIWDTDINDN